MFMKKPIVCILSALLIVILAGGFSFSSNKNESSFDIEDLYDYHKEFKSKEISVCARSGIKTYMDYRMTTVVASRQYQFMHNYMTVDKKTGFLYDKDGFIGVALGSFYGTIGDRFYFTLDSGIVLPLVKVEEKADVDTDYTGCYHLIDTSIIEFVIDEDYASNYFWCNGNGYVLNGNYNNYSLFEGEIVRVEKVLDEKNEEIVSYSTSIELNKEKDVFYYASGY